MILLLNSASMIAQMAKNLPAVWKIWVQSRGQEEPLEKGMATHSSILAWRIPGTEEPNRLQSMGLQRVRHYWVTNTFTSLSRWITLTEFQMLSKFYLSVRVLQRRSNRECVCVCEWLTLWTWLTWLWGLANPKSEGQTRPEFEFLLCKTSVFALKRPFKWLDEVHKYYQG